MAAAFELVPVSLTPMVTDAVAVERVTTVVVELTPELLVPVPVDDPDADPDALPEAELEPEPLTPGVIVVQKTLVVQETYGVT